jgi:hypothetical protein
LWRGHGQEAKIGSAGRWRNEGIVPGFQTVGISRRLEIHDQAPHHEAFDAMRSFLLPCAATGVSLLAVWCLIGATPRGQPWSSAVPLPLGRNGLGARRRAVLSTFRALSLGRLVHRELMRSALLNLTPIIAATACYQRNYVERYSRYKQIGRLCILGTSWVRG